MGFSDTFITSGGTQRCCCSTSHSAPTSWQFRCGDWYTQVQLRGALNSREAASTCCRRHGCVANVCLLSLTMFSRCDFICKSTCAIDPHAVGNTASAGTLSSGAVASRRSSLRGLANLRSTAAEERLLAGFQAGRSLDELAAEKGGKATRHTVAAALIQMYCSSRRAGGSTGGFELVDHISLARHIFSSPGEIFLLSTHLTCAILFKLFSCRALN